MEPSSTLLTHKVMFLWCIFNCTQGGLNMIWWHHRDRKKSSSNACWVNIKKTCKFISKELNKISIPLNIGLTA